MFKLRDYQNKAVQDLDIRFKELWSKPDSCYEFNFISPTGSGKTIMLAEFIRTLKTNLLMQDEVCFIWFSIGGKGEASLSQQSFDKLKSYYNDGTEFNLIKLEDVGFNSEIGDNSILFANWDSLVTRKKENLILTRENENSNESKWGDLITNTKKNRNIVLIIDESHVNSHSDLANDLKAQINPKIIINVSATPLTPFKKGSDIMVDDQDVIDSGLIKRSIIFQTEEDINSINNMPGLDQDEKMLELAIQKRDLIVNEYSKEAIKVKPLILIQLPNDSDKYSDKFDELKAKILRYIDKRIKADHSAKEKYQDLIEASNYRAIWLSGEQENLETITSNISQIEYLIFKQAAATGWDCPRASILVMFREIGNPIFKTQVIGRIRRMPEAVHYQSAILNNGYVFTNYDKNKIEAGYAIDKNKPKIFKSTRKPEIDTLLLDSEYVSRTDYNTLVSTEDKWQNIFIKCANEYFNTKRENDENINFQEFINKNGKLKTEIDNKILVNLKINSPDNNTLLWMSKTREVEYKLSQTDIEKYYNYLCYEVLKSQSEEQAIYNASRSKSPLKSAINVYFRNILGLKDFYSSIVNELINEQSNLRKVIKNALIEFKPVHDKLVGEKERNGIIPNLEIPPIELGFTDDYTEIKVLKNVYDKFYFPKNDKSGGNEKNFIDFLENNTKVEWWHKQSDHGKEHFSVIYKVIPDINKPGSFANALFYPDWIFKTTDGQIWIVDTKKGQTGVAMSSETREKMKGLNRWLSNNKQYKGGIVEPGINNTWFIIKSVNDDGTNIIQEEFLL